MDKPRGALFHIGDLMRGVKSETDLYLKGGEEEYDWGDCKSCNILRVKGN